MLTFNPGPSQLSKEVIEDIKNITESGLLSVSHRTSEFASVTERLLTNLRETFSIPSEHKIVFHHSATGAMETILRNFVQEKSSHIVQGAFSERMHQTALDLELKTDRFDVEWGKSVDIEQLHFSKDSELISVTHNETSTGLKWPNSALRKLRETYPNKLISLDMTSSFGSVEVDWNLADIHFLSVQKCLGLPAGLGLIILNESAQSSIKKNNIPAWQNLGEMIQKMDDFQTAETPNMLAIYLLEKQLKRWNLEKIICETSEKCEFVYSQKNLWKPFVKNIDWRSDTVINLEVNNPKQFHEIAQKNRFVLGNGYGKLKSNCIRLANFPSLDISHFKTITKLLNS